MALWFHWSTTGGTLGLASWWSNCCCVSWKLIHHNSLWEQDRSREVLLFDSRVDLGVARLASPLLSFIFSFPDSFSSFSPPPFSVLFSFLFLLLFSSILFSPLLPLISSSSLLFSSSSLGFIAIGNYQIRWEESNWQLKPSFSIWSYFKSECFFVCSFLLCTDVLIFFISHITEVLWSPCSIRHKIIHCGCVRRL